MNDLYKTLAFIINAEVTPTLLYICIRDAKGYDVALSLRVVYRGVCIYY